MRLPLRVVGDYHVDRLEVYAQQCVQLTSTNRPKAFLSKTEPKLSLSEKYCGGYSSVDPPLPIPNREVKHTNADGTAPPGGRVGRCRFSDARLSFQPGVFIVTPSPRKPPFRCPRMTPAAPGLPIPLRFIPASAVALRRERMPRVYSGAEGLGRVIL